MHLSFEFAFIDAILEGFVAVDQNYGNLRPIGLLQGRIRFHVDYSKGEWVAALYPFDDDLRVVAKVAAGSRVHIDANQELFPLNKLNRRMNRCVRAMSVAIWRRSASGE